MAQKSLETPLLGSARSLGEIKLEKTSTTTLHFDFYILLKDVMLLSSNVPRKYRLQIYITEDHVYSPTIMQGDKFKEGL